MRTAIFSLLLASSLGACATVSMVPAEAIVQTGISAEQSSLRKVSTAYIEQAEREKWVAKNKGLLGFARVLMDGAADSDEPERYQDVLMASDQPVEKQITKLASDIERAAHGLDVTTMEAKKLLAAEEVPDGLRADLVSYESALVTAKKARRTFASACSDLEKAHSIQMERATDALTAFELRIDEAREVADRLADFSANQNHVLATS